MKTTRRDFLKAGVTIAGVASGVSAANEIASSSDASAGQSSERMGEALPVPPTARKGDMPYRTLGSTGERVSALGVGGHHLGDFPTVDEAIRLVHEAIDAGIHLLRELLGVLQRQDRKYPRPSHQRPARQDFFNDQGLHSWTQRATGSANARRVAASARH